jgi:hypothetical protein
MLHIQRGSRSNRCDRFTLALQSPTWRSYTELRDRSGRVGKNLGRLSAADFRPSIAESHPAQLRKDGAHGKSVLFRNPCGRPVARLCDFHFVSCSRFKNHASLNGRHPVDLDCRGLAASRCNRFNPLNLPLTALKPRHWQVVVVAHGCCSGKLPRSANGQQ